MKAEQLLDISAKRNMIEWNLSTFKRTHPLLFKSIIEAIESAKKPIPVFIDSKCYHYNHEWKSDGQGGNMKYCNDCKCYV